MNVDVTGNLLQGEFVYEGTVHEYMDSLVEKFSADGWEQYGPINKLGNSGKHFLTLCRGEEKELLLVTEEDDSENDAW